MGVWRIGFGLYGETETWVPERGMPREWPAIGDTVPCDICVGELSRRRFTYTAKDGETQTGYRYTLTHYGKRHDRRRAA
jgi:hypothetical protein